MATDTQNRPYVRAADLKAGDVVTVDGGFTCLRPWSQHTVESDDDGLFIRCNDGTHHLAGQIDESGEYLIGVYRGAISQ